MFLVDKIKPINTKLALCSICSQMHQSCWNEFVFQKIAKLFTYSFNQLFSKTQETEANCPDEGGSMNPCHRTGAKDPDRQKEILGTEDHLSHGEDPDHPQRLEPRSDQSRVWELIG